jgi:hypothetical protein
MEDSETRALEGWRGHQVELSLEERDLELVDNALCLIPELRAVVRFAQEARRRGVGYPITSPKQLMGFFRGQSLRLGELRVDTRSMAHALAEEWFPLAHEGELLSAIHLAIRRCQAENEAAALDELRASSGTKRRARPGGQKTGGSKPRGSRPGGRK